MTTQNHDSDPICGNCGKPRSEHHTQPMGLFCSWISSGAFTAEPSDATLIAWMRRNFADAAEIVTQDWKRHHGHGG